MRDLPDQVSDWLFELVRSRHAVAHLFVDAGQVLISAGGDLERYGLAELQMQQPVCAQFPLLEGMLPLPESPFLLRSMGMPSGRVADIHFFAEGESTWVVFLDVTTEHDAARKMQQKAYDMTLLSQREARQAVANLVLFQEIFRRQKLEYAVCDENLSVVEHSPDLIRYVPHAAGPLPGQGLDQIFDLLYGMEDDLTLVVRKELPEVVIDKIGHSFEDGESGYYTLRVIHYRGGLLALVQDVTTECILEQRVTQQRNDLNLLGAQLARSRAELDYLLRRFVPSQVADRIISQPSQVKLGGEKRLVTALFADMRGFTQLSEVVSPEEMLDMLNQHFDVLGKVITSHGGVITNYAGDMVMAIFNAPEEQPDHAMQATRAGLEIQSALSGLTEKPRDDMPSVFDFGVGINTGWAVVGYLGYESRLEYTAIGISINVGSRFSGIARAGQVLVGRATHDLLNGRIRTRSLGEVTLRGKNESVEVFEALGDPEGEAHREDPPA